MLEKAHFVNHGSTALMKIVLVSTYNSDGFHFNGFYKGRKIKKVTLLQENVEFVEGTSYIVLLKEDKIREEELVAKVLAFKRLF